jgi:hypothetical protein
MVATCQVTVTKPQYGGELSPSQVRTFRDCGAKWYDKYALGLPDPPNGSLVRGRVHQMAEASFCAKLDGGSPSRRFASVLRIPGTAQPPKPPSERRRMSTCSSAKYLNSLAPEIAEFPVQGAIGGVPVRGFVDLLDTQWAHHRPEEGRAHAYRLQCGLRVPGGYLLPALPGSQREARVDTLVAIKSPQVVTQEYTVSPADLKMTRSCIP